MLPNNPSINRTLLLPLPLLLDLQTGWRKKTGTLLLFSLGIFIIITACIRLRYLIKFARSLDPTWDYTDTLIWTALEVNVSVIVASLPAIRVLLLRNLPKIFGSTQNSSGAVTSNTGGVKWLSKPSKGSSGLSTLFSSRTIRRGDDEDSESQLELGDHVYGGTRTEIAVDHRDEGDVRSNASSDKGIYVRKSLTVSPDREKALPPTP